MLSREQLRAVRKIQIRTSHLVSDLFAGQYQSVFKGRGMEFAEVRLYQPGDDVRTIDWNVTARSGTPHVKRFAEERELTVMLVVDQSGSTRFGEPRTKAALGVEVAAVLALAAARHNDRVGALLFADEIERVVPPRKGRRHALRVIRDLIAFEPRGRRTDLAAALSYATRLLHHRSIVAVISDFLAADWEKPLRRLASRHEVVAVTVDDPRERDVPDAGWLELADAESGRRVLVDTGSRAVRDRLAALARHRLDERRRMLAAAGVDHVALATDRDYAMPLRRAFAARARRVRR
jgi:uncharacterized protein (DUF58 family)